MNASTDRDGCKKKVGRRGRLRPTAADLKSDAVNQCLAAVYYWRVARERYDCEISS